MVILILYANIPVEKKDPAVVPHIVMHDGPKGDKNQKYYVKVNTSNMSKIVFRNHSPCIQVFCADK